MEASADTLVQGVLMSRPSRTSLFASLVVALAAAPGAARGDYLCTPVDVPGAAWTQLWQLNDAGQVAAGSALGGHVYSGGAWLPLPQPPPGYTPDAVNVLGINDSGVLAGGAGGADGLTGQAFILSGGTFQLFSYQPAVYPRTEARAISNAGAVTGFAYDGATSAGVAFVYNPGGAPGWPVGFTEIVPTLADGTAAWQTIPGAMNDAGQVVGSAVFSPGGRRAFLYDPAWAGHGYAGPITTFQIDGFPTSARGLNNKGYVAGFVRMPPSFEATGFLLTGAGHQLITCPDLPGAVEVYPESINDRDVISGIWADAAGTMHGFIAYPDVVLPVASAGGAFLFDVAVSPATPVFLDPEVAVGYRYETGAGDPRFATVALPIGVGDDVYTLLAEGHAFTVPAGQTFDFTRNGFTAGVAAFEVLGIETSAAVDPASPTAFVTEVTFAGAGRFTGRMTPMTPADVLADLRQATVDAGVERDLVERARRGEHFFAAGKTSAACKALGDLVGKAARKADGALAPALAAALVAEARAAADALGCGPAASE